ncbi:hypothetical protein HKX48_002350, partial [Thoreauomyces humboldtii]
MPFKSLSARSTVLTTKALLKPQIQGSKVAKPVPVQLLGRRHLCVKISRFYRSKRGPFVSALAKRAARGHSAESVQRGTILAIRQEVADRLRASPFVINVPEMVRLVLGPEALLPREAAVVNSSDLHQVDARWETLRATPLWQIRPDVIYVPQVGWVYAPTASVYGAESVPSLDGAAECVLLVPGADELNDVIPMDVDHGVDDSSSCPMEVELQALPLDGAPEVPVASSEVPEDSHYDGVSSARKRVRDNTEEEITASTSGMVESMSLDAPRPSTPVQGEYLPPTPMSLDIRRPSTVAITRARAPKGVSSLRAKAAPSTKRGRNDDDDEVDPDAGRMWNPLT